MIVYELECRDHGHRFEGWFKSSGDYARQHDDGLVSCPFCGTSQVDKAIQAPRLARKGNQLPEPARRAAGPAQMDEAASGTPEAVPVAPVSSQELPPQAIELIHRLSEMQANALKGSRYVGGTFAEDARAMHYGEREVEAIHGETSLADAQELMEEGISVVPLPFPIAPPEEAN